MWLILITNDRSTAIIPLGICVHDEAVVRSREIIERHEKRTKSVVIQASIATGIYAVSLAEIRASLPADKAEKHDLAERDRLIAKYGLPGQPR